MPEWLKISEYAKKHGITVSRVKELINAKLLRAEQEAKGSHIWVLDVPYDVVPRGEYAKLERENAALKEKLSSIFKLAANE